MKKKPRLQKKVKDENFQFQKRENFLTKKSLLFYISVYYSISKAEMLKCAVEYFFNVLLESRNAKMCRRVCFLLSYLKAEMLKLAAEYVF